MVNRGSTGCEVAQESGVELDNFNFLDFEPVPVFVPVQYSKGNASGLQLELALALGVAAHTPNET